MTDRRGYDPQFSRFKRWVTGALVVIGVGSALYGWLGYHETTARQRETCASVRWSLALITYYEQIAPTIDDLGIRKPVDDLLAAGRAYNRAVGGTCGIKEKP